MRPEQRQPRGTLGNPLRSIFVEAKAKARGRCVCLETHGELEAKERHTRGETVNDNDASEGQNLEEGTRQANSNLQRLIEAVGALLAVSGEVLGRLQQILSGAQSAPGGDNGSDGLGTPPTTDRCDC